MDRLEIPIYINFIDEDGEVLQLKTTKNEETSQLFGRYALQQGTPFLLSRVMYEFRYIDQLIGLNATIGSLGIAAYSMISDDNVIIYVTNKLPIRAEFNDRIVPNIPYFVNDHPHCFMNQQIRVGIDERIIGTVNVNADSDGDTDSFIFFEIEWSYGKTELHDKEEFTEVLQKYYSDLNGFHQDIKLYLEGLVSKYESQVEQLDAEQSLDKPNVIILRMIKIRQQIHRLLSVINSVTDEDERGLSKLDSFSDRLRKVLSSLSDEMKSHVSNTSLHKVKKPLFESEDIILAKLWPNNNKNLEPSWEKGIVRSYEEHEDVDGYGPRRVYSVEFDNRECRSDIEDYQVIPGKEYYFMDKGGQNEIVLEGETKLKHIFDEDSGDPWAREVGWYTVEMKGVEDTFVHLSEAMLAHASGSSVVLNRGSMHDDYKTSVSYLRIGVLQLIDRISDPIMRRIGEVLLQPVEYRPAEDEFCEVEQEGFIWKTARGHHTDQHTTQMKDSVYKFALLKQCKIFGSDESANIDQLCRFFISSEGCLDTFLIKVPIFREGYDATVSSESDHEKDFNSRHFEVFGYLNDNEPEDAYYFLSIKFADDKESKRFICQIDEPIKALLTKYAVNRDTSIKSLRIKHNDKTIFISSIGKKTPDELGINDNDVIEVTIIQSTPTEMSTNEQSKQQSPKGKNKKKNKKHKKSKKKRAQPLVIQKTETELRGEHSKLLGKVYEEAESQFKEIRQRLNALNLERTKPKQKKKSKVEQTAVEVVDNPLGDGQLGGKAGKTQFIIQVGEVSNLYKTTKPSSAGRGRRQEDIMIDLHGLTAEETVNRLDKSLPDWIEIAMKGTHPFVIPVKIVCGGGSQILAEVVENWIKQNDHVANAPKNMYS